MAHNTKQRKKQTWKDKTHRKGNIFIKIKFWCEFHKMKS